ncbi:MAG: spore coat U domain-containing protein [Caldimonas sp.]
MTTRWLLAGCLLLGAAAPAHALCTLACSCQVVATPVVFASVNPLSASPVDSTGKVTVTCGGLGSLAVPYTLAASAGISGVMTSRRMAAGANRLAYNLYTTSTYLTVLGDGTGGTVTAAGSVLTGVLGQQASQDTTLYGRIAGGQNQVVPGSFTDSVIVTVTYF